MNRLFLFILCNLLFTSVLCQEIKTIHVFVALCDNKNQGIVPVSKLVGNGQDPKNNLYWGAGYGVKSYFSASTDWKLISKTVKPKENVLERILYKHTKSNTYLLADAYDGAKIKEATIDFLHSCYGVQLEKVKADSQYLQFGGSSNVVAYIGHDGLMDFQINLNIKATTNKKREAVILACASKPYFYSFIKQSGSYPILWTTHLMCPEAYSLKAALDGWIINETNDQIRERAAKAYSQYQKCSINGARRLLVTGW
jgi:hypothetical protein